MIHYKDKTFCNSPNCKNKCGKKLTEEIKQAATKWWGGEDAPISTARYCDENGEIIN